MTTTLTVSVPGAVSAHAGIPKATSPPAIKQCKMRKTAPFTGCYTPNLHFGSIVI
ncbi:MULTISPECIES: hypothetical protein [unclassified Sphingomonas]|uniref:hypothetical protein n=1 Tax=unclassified Sphingomonas TaxID=196159 RepID=UPI0012E16F32|nr:MULTISPECIES: hypothetical protein [unclassified Sphingomonas]